MTADSAVSRSFCTCSQHCQGALLGRDQLSLKQQGLQAWQMQKILLLQRSKDLVRDIKLADNAGGRITGDVMINGHPQKADSFARVSGYVEQTGMGPCLQDIC